MVHMSFKNTGFRLGIFLLFVVVGFVIGVQAFEDNGTSAENKIDCRYKGHYESTNTRSVVVAGNYAYIVDRDYGLVIVDIANKTDPQEAGHRGGSAYGVAVAGDYAYVAYNEGGLVIVDISNKTDPKEVGHYETSDQSTDVVIVGHHAYVADFENGLVIVDITNKTNPQEAGHCDTSGKSHRVAVAGDYAYIADRDNGLVIIDIANNSDPKQVGHYENSKDAMGVAVTGNYAYVADRNNGLFIVDITNKTDPQETGHYGGLAYGVAVAGDYAYVADEDTSLVIVDISEKTNPLKAGHYDSSGYPNNIAVAENYAYVADGANGLVIVELAPVAWIDSISPTPSLDTNIVEFKGHGTDDGTIKRYVWQSSIDGELYNSTSPNFSTGDLSTGTHTIYFKVKDDYGVWSTEVMETLVVHKKPTATIDSVTPNSALERKEISFEGHGIDDGTIERYVWTSSIDGELHNDTDSDFKTKQISNGTHTIYFKVKDNYDVWSEEVSDTLVINGKPRARIDSVAPGHALEKSVVNFKGQGTDDGSVKRYVWTSSIDGEIHNSSTADFSTDELSNGTHTIHFKVKDNNDVWSDEVWMTLTINGKPRARIDSIIPGPALDIDVVELKGQGTDDGSIVRYVWTSSRDGEIHNSTGANFTTNQLSNGTHTIYFKVEDNKDVWSDEVSGILTINGKPWAQINEIIPNPALDTAVIEFEGSGTDDGFITAYNWRSNEDGELSTENAFNRSDLTKGTHQIYFKVRDNSDVWSDEVSTPLIIHEKPIAIIDSISPKNASEGETVYFSGHGNDDGSIKSFNWRSNIDGQLSTSTFYDSSSLSVGNHTIYFKVKDDNGAWSDEVFDTVTITKPPPENEPPIPHLSANNTIIYVNSEVEFNCSGSTDSDGTVEEYFIEFGDSTDSGWQGSAIVRHTYTSGGYYNATLSVRDNENVKSTNSEKLQIIVREYGSPVNIRPLAYIDSISPDPVVKGETVYFSGHGNDDGTIQRYSWRSSIDGHLSDSASFETSSLSSGTHTIYFKVQDNDNAWSDEVSTSLMVSYEDSPTSLSEQEMVLMLGCGLALVAIFAVGLLLVFGNPFSPHQHTSGQLKIRKLPSQPPSSPGPKPSRPQPPSSTVHKDGSMAAQKPVLLECPFSSNQIYFLTHFLNQANVSLKNVRANPLIMKPELEGKLKTIEDPTAVFFLFLVMKQLSYLTVPRNEWLIDMFHNHRDKFKFSSYFEMPESPSRVLEEWNLPKNLKGKVHLDKNRQEIVDAILRAEPDENFVIIGEPGVGKTAVLFEVFDCIMRKENAGLLTSENIGKFHESQKIRLFYDDIPENQKLVNALVSKRTKGLIVTARKNDWDQLPGSFQNLFKRMTIGGFLKSDLKVVARNLFSITGISAEPQALDLLMDYAQGSPIYIWTTIREMRSKGMNQLTLQFLRKNAAMGMVNYIINILGKMLRKGQQYREGGYHSFIMLYILANHFEERKCHSLLFNTTSEKISAITSKKFKSSLNPSLLRLIITYLDIKKEIVRFPHDSWADVVLGEGEQNPFKADLAYIKRYLVDTGVIEKAKKEALGKSWTLLLSRYSNNPRTEKDSFLGFCENILRNFTLSGLEDQNVNIEKMRGIANQYSNLPIAEKILGKIERLRPSVTQKTITITDSVVMRSKIG